mgnify:CR=1 FL=1
MGRLVGLLAVVALAVAAGCGGSGGGGSEGTLTIYSGREEELVKPLFDRFEETVEEARRLWKTVDRPNVMVKVPGTEQGAIAVRRFTA